MARESKRRRDERRFGRPERLADIALNTPADRWLLGSLPHTKFLQNPGQIRPAIASMIGEFQRDIGRSIVVKADDAAVYYFEHPRDEWDVTEDLPSCSPPFSMLFVEFAVPGSVVVDGGTRRSTDGFPDMAGATFSAIESERLGNVFPDAGNAGITPKPMPDAKWFVKSEFLVARDGRPIFLGAIRWFAVSGDGRILGDPHHMVMGLDTVSPEQRKLIANATTEMWMLPALLAINFMNCKNVTLNPHEPDRQVNRDRKGAGLRPFVRYHTIDIEPMREVLRTEGGVDQNGLKRAMHLVRGHFVRRTIPNEVTYWRSAHVRGSIKEGVVVSDYRVHAPEGGRL